MLVLRARLSSALGRSGSATLRAILPILAHLVNGERMETTPSPFRGGRFPLNAFRFMASWTDKAVAMIRIPSLHLPFVWFSEPSLIETQMGRRNGPG
jgi:hypothetical protein